MECRKADISYKCELNSSPLIRFAFAKANQNGGDSLKEEVKCRFIQV